MNKIQKIKELIEKLDKCSYEYYVLDQPSISDKQYDQIFDELQFLEQETNFILSSSPTQKVQGKVLPFLKEVKHTELMLSADKSKDINDIIKFMGDQECVLSWKLDGCSIILRYNNGKFLQAITRGGGEKGEDVTHTVMTFKNVPMQIDYKGYLEVRGEGLVTFKDFERINNELIFRGEKTYSSPRNLAAGSVRQLDSNITKDRNLIFKVFGIVKYDINYHTKFMQFDFLADCGFDVVEHVVVDKNLLNFWIENYKERIITLPYLTDGLIVEYDDIAYGKTQGVTGHHSKNMFALKWADDSYETIFRGVGLNTTRTGMVSLTALFDEVDIDGVKVSRATLHNYDIFKELQLGVGDIISVYRANAVIPQIEDNLIRSNTYNINMKCPSCGGSIIIKTPKEARFLFCENEDCPSRLVNKIVHYCSKNAANIDGFSEAGIETFINKGFLKTFSDIYKLEKYKSQIINLEGWGIKSYNNLIDSIDESKNTELYRLIYGIGIPQIGLSGSKNLCKYFNNDINKIINSKYEELYNVKDFGGITASNVVKYFYNKNNLIEIGKLLEYIKIKNNNIISSNKLQDLVFVITGTLSKPREEFQRIIENKGGKTTGTISKKTNYLLAGDNIGETKIKKAVEYGIKIISENDFNLMM
jgi:DNA ligase (NAD+)